MNKDTKTTGNRYFEGGRNFKKELIIAGGLIFVSIVLSFIPFGRKFGFMLYLLSSLPGIVGIIMLVSLFTGRITDSGYNEYMENQLVNLWSNQTETEGAVPDHTIIEYECVGEAVTRKKKGSDNKIRTDILCRTELFFEPGALRVKQGFAQADGENARMQTATLPMSKVTASIETRTNAQLDSLTKSYMALSVEGGEPVAFPIPENDYDMEALMEKINHTRDRAAAEE